MVYKTTIQLEVILYWVFMLSYKMEENQIILGKFEMKFKEI